MTDLANGSVADRGLRWQMLDWTILLIPFVGLAFWLGYRSFAACHAILFLLPLFAAFGKAWQKWWCRGRAEKSFLFLVVVWLVMVGCWASLWSPFPRIAQGRWAQDMTAVCGFLVSAHVLGGWKRGLFTIAIASATAFILQLFCFWVFGEPALLWGHVNYLGSCAAPSLMAGTLLFGSEKAPAWRKLIVGMLAIGIIVAFAFLIIPNEPRRGILLSSGCMFAVYGWYHFWLKRPRIASSVMIVVVVAALVGFVVVLPELQQSARGDRYFLYRAALAQAQDFFPWGGGPFTSLRFEESSDVVVRMRLAAGHVATHVHNEFIEAAMNYGVLGIGLVMSLMAWLVHWSLKLQSRRGAVGLALLAGFGVHALVDNSFGQLLPQVVVAITLGACFRIDEATGGKQTVTSRPIYLGLQMGGWIAAMLTFLVFLGEIPAIVEDQDASPAVRARVLNSTRNVDTLRIDTDRAMRELSETAPLSTLADRIAQEATVQYRAIGEVRTWHLRILNQRNAIYHRRILQAMAEWRTGKPGSFASWWKDILASAETDRLLMAAVREGIHRFPFSAGTYQCGFDILQRRADLAAVCDTRLRMRIGVYGRCPVIPVAQWPEGRETIDDIADVVSLVRADLINNQGALVSPDVIRKLADIGGEVDDVAYIVVQWLLSAGRSGDLPADWQIIGTRVTQGWRNRGEAHDISFALREIQTLKGAAAAMQIMNCVAPGYMQKIGSTPTEKFEIDRLWVITQPP